MMKKFTTFLMAGMGLLLCTGALADSATPDLIWTGNGLDSLWNTSSLNWKTYSGETSSAFTEGQIVTFTDGLANFRDTTIVGTDTTIRNVNRRYIRLKDSLTVGGMIFDSPNAYSLVSDAIDGGAGYVIDGDFQLVQKGTGVLTLEGMNFTLDNTQGTLIQNGTIRLNGPKTAKNVISETAVGPKVVLDNGHLLMTTKCNTASTTTGYEQMKWDIEIPDNSTGTFTFDQYCVHEGALTGSESSVFNVNYRCVREVLAGNMSAFKGTINPGIDHSQSSYILFTAESGFACAAFIIADTFGLAEFDPNGILTDIYPRDDFATQIDTAARLALGYTYTTRYPLGLPDATVNLNDSILMVWGCDLTLANGSSNMYRDGATCRIGALNGTNKTLLGSTRQGNSSTNHTWEIGGLGTDAVFGGKIINSGFKNKSGLTNNIIKVGAGDWELTYPTHSFVGNLEAKEGSLTTNSTFATTSNIIVDSGAVLKGSPTFSAPSTTTFNGTIEIGGEASSHGIGEITVNKGPITFGKDATLRIGLGQGGRCDQLNYDGLVSFDANSTIEFFVEENTVKAGDTLAIFVPISSSLSASISEDVVPQIVCQEGLELNTEWLLLDPQFADDAEIAYCGKVIVVSNTATGPYSSVAPVVTAVSPEALSAVSTSGTIVLTYDKAVARGTGNITMGEVAFEPVIDGTTATITFSGLSAEPDTFQLVIPAGAMVDASDNAACSAFSAKYVHDKVLPVLTAQSVAADSVMSWVDGSITFTFSENVAIADTAGITITKTQYEKVTPSVSGGVLTVAYTGLNYASNYTLSIAAGAITDKVGNPAAGITLNFSTKAVGIFTRDSALNGKTYTTLPIVQDTIVYTGGTYPLWAAYYSSGGSFADGEMTWTSSNSNNKIMACFLGTATTISVTVRRTGTDNVGLSVQESPAEANVAAWRTIENISMEKIGTEKTTLSYTLSPNIRFIKIKPTTASSSASLIISAYEVQGTTAIEDTITSILPAGTLSVRYCNVAGGLMLDGLNAGSRIDVYNLAGIKTTSMVAEGSSVTVPVSGFALVKIVSQEGTAIIKAIVK